VVETGHESLVNELGSTFKEVSEGHRPIRASINAIESRLALNWWCDECMPKVIYRCTQTAIEFKHKSMHFHMVCCRRRSYRFAGNDLKIPPTLQSHPATYDGGVMSFGKPKPRRVGESDSPLSPCLKDVQGPHSWVGCSRRSIEDSRGEAAVPRSRAA
jgi:hypothetical protein